MMSRRYAPALIGLLLVALLPTMRHGYLGFVEAAPPVTEALLPVVVAGATGAPHTLPANGMVGAYDAQSWAERIYQVPGGGRVSLLVVRGFDHKKLYHHPELGALRGRTFGPLKKGVLPGPSADPVYLLQNTTGGESAVYALLFGDRWVADPYLHQVASALSTLWAGRRPMTLVFASGDVLVDGQPTPFVSDLLRAAAARLGTSQTGAP